MLPYIIDYDKWPGAEKMKAVKSNRPRGGWYSYPAPDDCIIDMINSQLEVREIGKLIELCLNI